LLLLRTCTCPVRRHRLERRTRAPASELAFAEEAKDVFLCGAAAAAAAAAAIPIPIAATFVDIIIRAGCQAHVERTRHPPQSRPPPDAATATNVTTAATATTNATTNATGTATTGTSTGTSTNREASVPPHAHYYHLQPVWHVAEPGVLENAGEVD
jgi:hypothetical protein